MGFLDGIVSGIGRAATGGDGAMDLTDYLRLGGMALAAGTGNVPALAAMGTGALGDATGSQALKTAGAIGSLAAGGAGLASGAAGGAGSTVADFADASAAAASPLEFTNTVSQIGATGADTLQGMQGAAAAGGGFKSAINKLIGGTNGKTADIAQDLMAMSQQEEPAPPPVSELPWQDDGSYANYVPSINTVQQFLSASQQQRPGPYSGAYNGAYGG